jgi:hypothetical protein
MSAAAQAARHAPPRPGKARAIDLLLDGLALRFGRIRRERDGAQAGAGGRA